MSFLELLRTRRSIRRFTAQEVEPEKIETIKKAVLMSPAGKHSNPWEFIFIQNKSILAKLSTCKEHGADFVGRAPLAVVIAADAQKSQTWIEDCSIAATIIQLTAESQGLSSCWAQCRMRLNSDGSSAEDIVKRTLEIPEHFNVLCIIAIGYKDEERKPFDDSKLQSEKIHDERFNNSKIQ